MNDKLWFLQSVLPSRLVLIGRQNSTICHTYTSIQCERRWIVYTRKKYKLIFIYDVHVLCMPYAHPSGGGSRQKVRIIFPAKNLKLFFGCQLDRTNNVRCTSFGYHWHDCQCVFEWCVSLCIIASMSINSFRILIISWRNIMSDTQSCRNIN